VFKAKSIHGSLQASGTVHNKTACSQPFVSSFKVSRCFCNLQRWKFYFTTNF